MSPTPLGALWRSPLGALYRSPLGAFGPPPDEGGGNDDSWPDSLAFESFTFPSYNLINFKPADNVATAATDDPKICLPAMAEWVARVMNEDIPIWRLSLAYITRTGFGATAVTDTDAIRDWSYWHEEYPLNLSWGPHALSLGATPPTVSWDGNVVTLTSMLRSQTTSNGGQFAGTSEIPRGIAIVPIYAAGNPKASDPFGDPIATVLIDDQTSSSTSRWIRAEYTFRWTARTE